MPPDVVLALRTALWRARPLLVLAAVLAGAALAARPFLPTPPGAPVVVAARDVPEGHELTADDVRTARLVGPLPAGAPATREEVLGARTAVALPRGLPLAPELLTTERFGTDPPDGTVTVPVRLADAAVATLLRPGDRVDLVAPDPDVPGAGAPTVLARRALVLEVVLPDAPGDGLLDGWSSGDTAVLTVVAVPPDAGHRIAGHGSGSVGAVLVEGS